MRFETGGKSHVVPIPNIYQVVEPYEAEAFQYLKRKFQGKRVSLRDIDTAGFMLVSDGWARAKGERFQAVEKLAREDRYGIWGGNSYEKDMEEWERLKGKFAEND